MEYDSEGFLYPQVDNSKCIRCGLCLKVCPITNNKKENKVLDVYGAKNKNVEANCVFGKRMYLCRV